MNQTLESDFGAFVRLDHALYAPFLLRELRSVTGKVFTPHTPRNDTKHLLLGAKVSYGNAKNDYGLDQWEGYMATFVSLKDPSNGITHTHVAFNASQAKYAIRTSDGNVPIASKAWTYFG